jgi:hypothetical protein
MLEILRDQIWQFVGATFGFVAIIVSTVLYWTQRRRKALSYDIIVSSPLVSAVDEIKGRLEIYFDGKPVQDIHLVGVKIINSGNVPIVSADYERPVSLSFGREAEILSAKALEPNPDSLQASVDIEATRVVLKPVLLNGGDSITLTSLVSGLSEISVDGRIVGVKDMRELAGVRGLNPFMSLLLLLLYGAFGLTGLGGLIIGFGTTNDLGGTLIVSGLCLLFIVAVIVIVVNFLGDLVKARLLGR